MATYDLTSSIPTKIVTDDILNCPYSGTYKTIALPKGIYKFECWGAQGGYDGGGSSYFGGKGGYSVGTIILSEQKTIYIYVGGKGAYNGTVGGFNGGGSWTGSGTPAGGTGGGASDIRIGQDSLYARIIVAGGGGGGCNWSSNYGTGGYGGGVTGGDGDSTTSSYPHGLGGTQTAGGSYSSGSQGSYKCSAGSFGQGGQGAGYNTYGGAGGGGWYGGGGGCISAGAGGSGYVYTLTTASNYPQGCLLDSSMYLTDASIIAGNASMPSTSGSTEMGHSDNGYVRITAILVSKDYEDLPGYDITEEIPDELKSGDVLKCPYTGDKVTIQLPRGIYKFECWGAQGGNIAYSSYSAAGGKGGYSVGTLLLNETTTLYIYTGGQGVSGDGINGLKAGGFNGGGQSYYDSTAYLSGSGGGASDIRIGEDSLYARVIVGGGGGGAGSYDASHRYIGGDGGGVSGITPSQYNDSYKSGEGGSQTSKGISHYYTNTDSTTYGTLADFGVGAGAINGKTYRVTGGGGGWYGGGSGGRAAGGGGSGYVYTPITASNYPNGCLLNSAYYLVNAETKAGNTSFPAVDEGDETGHSGRGFVKITVLQTILCKYRIDDQIENMTVGYVKVNNTWNSIVHWYLKYNNTWND